MPSNFGSMWSAISNIREFRRDPLEFLRGRHRRLGDIFRFRLGPIWITFFATPAHIEEIYSQPKVFQRSKIIQTIRQVTGDSILVSVGEKWKSKRLLAQPV